MVYNINPNISEKYTKYMYYNYICKLTFNIDKFDHTLREQKKLYNQLLASEAKNIRLRKLLRRCRR